MSQHKPLSEFGLLHCEGQKSESLIIFSLGFAYQSINKTAEFDRGRDFEQSANKQRKVVTTPPDKKGPLCVHVFQGSGLNVTALSGRQGRAVFPQELKAF